MNKNSKSSGKSLFASIWRIIKTDRLALAGTYFMLFIILVAVFAPIVSTHDPDAMNYKVEGTAIWLENQSWRIEEGIINHTLNAVKIANKDSIMAIGDDGVVMAFQGGKWQEITSPADEKWNSIDFRDGIWMLVGENGTAAIYDGKEWTVTQTGIEENINAISILSQQKAMAVADAGIVLVWNGIEWKKLTSDTKENLNDVQLYNESLGFIVGDRNIILSYDGNTLKREMVMGYRSLYAIDIFDENKALIVGERGTIFQYNGRTWQAMYGPETRDMSAVAWIDENTAIGTGAHGVVLKLEGNQWQKVNTGYRRHLKDVDAFDNTLIAVGTDPYVNSLEPPSWQHFFGTTHNGRDIFSQVVYGSRTALLVGLIAAVMVTLIGTNVGIISGYFKGKTDNIIMRIVDIMYALPLEPFAMILVLLTRPGLGVIILSVGLLTWRTTARIIRSQVLSISARPFIKAAKVAGASHFRILFVHIAPNTMPLAFLQLAVAMAYAITAEATLSFLGLGPPKIFSWGTILHQARLSGAWRTAWWWIIPPGLLIMLTVVSVFFISRALEVLTNPRLERRQ